MSQADQTDFPFRPGREHAAAPGLDNNEPRCDALERCIRLVEALVDATGQADPARFASGAGVGDVVEVQVIRG